LLRAIVPSNVEIVLDAQEREIAIAGDPSLIHQVVINLCTNAYQAMRRSGGRLLIRLWSSDEPLEGLGESRRAAVMEVTDTGHGIDPTIIAHVFEPFFTTRDVGEGTGLGLSVVHGIVTSMGGAISVESTVGKGTTFRVYLPMAQSAVSALGAASDGMI